MGLRLTLAAGLLAGSATLAPALAQDQKPLRIATEGARPPYNYLDANSAPAGFEVELARVICARLGRPCEIVSTDYDRLLPELNGGRFDAVMAALTPSDERRKQAAFTRPYFHIANGFVTCGSTQIADFTPPALKGRTLTAEEGSPHARLLEEVYEPEGVTIKTFSTEIEASLEVASGRADAVFAERLFLRDWLTGRGESQHCRLAGLIAEDVQRPYFGEGFAIAVRRADTALRMTLNDQIAALRRDGTLRQLADTHASEPVR